VSEHNGQIGSYGTNPYIYEIWRRRHRWFSGCGFGGHPKFRRQGIFLAIGKILTKEAEKEGIDITYGFPNKLAPSGHYEVQAWDLTSAMQADTAANAATIYWTAQYEP